MVASWVRMKFCPKSNRSCSLKVSLLKASWMIGTLDASYLMMLGGVVPTGKGRSRVWEMAVICASAVRPGPRGIRAGLHARPRGGLEQPRRDGEARRRGDGARTFRPRDARGRPPRHAAVRVGPFGVLRGPGRASVAPARRDRPRSDAPRPAHGVRLVLSRARRRMERRPTSAPTGVTGAPVNCPAHMARWERKEIVLRTSAVGQAMTAPVFWCHGRNPPTLASI